jgi:hypothetical protein
VAILLRISSESFSGRAILIDFFSSWRAMILLEVGDEEREEVEEGVAPTSVA